MKWYHGQACAECGKQNFNELDGTLTEHDDVLAGLKSASERPSCDRDLVEELPIGLRPVIADEGDLVGLMTIEQLDNVHVRIVEQPSHMGW